MKDSLSPGAAGAPSPGSPPNRSTSDGRRGSARTVAWSAAAAVTVATLAAAGDWWWALPEGIQATHVGRDTCITCHAEEGRKFAGSDHDRAMEIADKTTVLGDFDNQKLEHFGITTRMFRRDGRYYMETQGPDGQPGEFEVKYTFGYRPLQQYLAETERGRLQVLPATWDVPRQKWYFANPDAWFGPEDPLHWTGSAQNWQHMCADCHSTNFAKNFDLKTQMFHSTYSEIDVSCEACHGPGSLHVQLAESPSLFWDRRYGYGLVRLKGADATRQLETCAPCHSRRNHISSHAPAGGDYFDHFNLALLDEGLYHPDGQILEEVYEFGSFTQSLMYRKGVRCTDCHDPHTTRLKFEGNRLCAQCHVPAKYDVPAHHHHPANSRGALCVECHMPSKNYMVIDPRRDHSIRRPRPDLTVSIGVPNACNDCHDKPAETPQWAADKIVEWFGPDRKPDPHYGEIIAAARQGAPEAESSLIKLTRDRDVGPVVRATAVSLLGRHYHDSDAQAALTRSLEAKDPMVRAAAAQAWQGLASVSPEGAREFVDRLAPLLGDPSRLVRIEAARLLAPIAAQALDRQQETQFDDALDEWIAAQMANADQAGAHLSLGVVYDQLGRTAAAIDEYRTAIALDPAVAGPRSNLSEILDRQGQTDAAQELRRDEEKLIARDSRLLPDHAGLHYRLGLLRYLLGDEQTAEPELAAAVRLDPQNAEFLLTLTLLYEKQERWDEAAVQARLLDSRFPGNPMFVDLRDRIQARRNSR